ncbi:hypothetical protein F4802DRAFT_578043 [Xylaria palmicola]|nr:hypothetical protein F4802DRAFT_578043 [Xylaria palmicola]
MAIENIMNKSQETTATGTPASFFVLSSELRNEIYELVLLHEEPINPWDWGIRELTPGLFRVNKAIHTEACSLFYSGNHFDLTAVAQEEIARFLRQIGSANAGYIRHIIIHFPEFLSFDPGHVALKDDSVDMLATIQSSCTSLRTLRTSLYTTNAMEVELGGLENHELASEALDLVGNHLKAIASLPEIILQIYEDCPSSHIRERIKNHGWTISTEEYVEEEEDRMSFSDFDNDDEYGYYDDYGDDEYDIDNDSDFWRRAAD